MKKRNFNKIIGMILCLALVIATITTPSISHAAAEEELITAGLVVYESHDDVANYRVNKTYPSAETAGDYVFAGWYYLDGTTYKPYGVGGADHATKAYAKFVDAKVLGAKFQLTADTTTESAQTDIRLVTSVDSANYSSVGFNVTYNGKTLLCSSSNVYATINQIVDGEPEAIYPTVLSDASAYFATHRITGVTNDAFDKEWTVQPTWTTLDGTTVVASASEVKTITVDQYAAEPYVVDFENGVNFENANDLGVVAPYNGANGWEGLWGANTSNVSLQSFNGSTQLAVTPGTSGEAWPTFFVNLGKTYPAGTVFTFDCYYNSGGNSTVTLWDYSTAGYVSAPIQNWVTAKEATTITYTLQSECDRVAIQYSTWGDATYFDNFLVVPPIDFEAGVNFEKASHLDVVAPYNGSNGWAGLWGANTSNVSLQSFNGSTQLAVTPGTSGEAWPTFFVNLGKTYPAGTVFTFDCYYNSGGNSTVTLWDYSTAGYVSAPVQNWITAKEATTITYTLQSECDRVAIQYSTWGDATYFDNFLVTQPEPPIDFEVGVDFEKASHLDVVAPFNGSNGWAGLWGANTSNVSLQSFNGSTQLAVTPGTSGEAWPTFFVSLGKSYPAGTVLTFDCYYNSGGGSTVKLWDYSTAGYVSAEASYWADAKVATTITYTLQSECDRVAIQYSTWGDATYFDNFKIVQ